MTLNAPSLSGVEFTHKLLGATLRYALVDGTATVVLPLKGLWTVTAIEKPNEYSELRLVGSMKLS